MDAEEHIYIFILRKLFRRRYIGGRHTSIANLQKGLPSDLKGSAKTIVKKLIKDELLLPKPTHDGIHVSLNPRKIEEINKILEKSEPENFSQV